MRPTKSLSDILREIYWGEAHSSPDERGDGSALGRLHAAEEGMVSLVTVVAVLFFLVLLGLLANAARVTNQKVEVQNSADAVAYSSALCMARGMNTVTAANHVMGELTAINVLIDAIGGVELFQPGSIQQPTATQTNLNTAIMAVGAAASPVSDYDPERTAIDLVTSDRGKPPTSGGMLYDARMTLKFWTWYALAVQVIANAAQAFPPIGEFVGGGLTALCEAVCAKVIVESQLLNLLEQIAQSVLPPIRQAIDQLLPVINAYQMVVVAQTTLAVAATVRSVSSADGVSGALYPDPADVRLPVQPEPPPVSGQNTYQPSQSVDYPSPARELIGPYRAAQQLLNSKDPFVRAAVNALKKVFGPLANIPDEPSQNPAGYPDNPSQKPFASIPIDPATEPYSQWVRATYPWVNTWRAPLQGVMKSNAALSFSLAGNWYQSWTNKYTLARSHYYRTAPGGNLAMYVMQDTQPNHKGEEPWTRREGSRLAEQRFMVVAFAHRPAPRPFSPTLYKQPNPDGFVAYAQAMLYNANDQSANRPSGFQPQVGWDTLNWKAPVNQSGANEFDQGATTTGSNWAQALDFLHPSGRQPLVVLNWQAKLVPVTRLREASESGRLPAKIQKVLERTPDLPGMTNH